MKKEDCSISNKKNNFESFDVWGKANFILWTNARFDFELIAELTRHIKSTRTCLDLLHTVNSYLKNQPEKVFFDGTIKCLKYLIKNNYLDISDLPRLTQDEKYLVDLLKRYSKRLDLTDILFDIEEPTIRAILLEYPNLLTDVIKNPVSNPLIVRAMIKNGIVDIKTFDEKISNPEEGVEVDGDKNSKEALKCKIIFLGLRINTGKISIPRGATDIIHEFGIKGG